VTGAWPLPDPVKFSGSRGPRQRTQGWRPALWLMAAMLAVVLTGVVLSLPRTLGKAKSSRSFRELFAKTRPINRLAAARIFMAPTSFRSRCQFTAGDTCDRLATILTIWSGNDDG
jgi:hypothetical protein